MRSKLTEATTHLSDLRVKMEQRFQDARTYAGGPCAPTGAAAVQVKYFDFSCPDGPDADAFPDQAAGKRAPISPESPSRSMNRTCARRS